MSQARPETAGHPQQDADVDSPPPDDRETAELSQAVNDDNAVPDALSQAADNPATARALDALDALG